MFEVALLACRFRLRALRRGARFAISAFVVSAVALGLSGCRLDVLAPIGPIGEADKEILIDSVAIMLVIVVPSIVAVGAVGWWFRASNPRATYDPRFVYSGKVELVMWSIPLLTVLLLGGVIWIGSHQLDPARPLPSAKPPLDVQVVSLDWKWLFLYPNQRIASVNELVAPVGTPLRLALTSGSVMNVFFVPGLGSMIYTMNGMVVHLNLQADKTGVFLGRSAHFSGDGFSDMQFQLRAVSDSQFADWVRQAPTGAAFDAQAYEALARQSAADPPSVHPLADVDLFEKIATQKLPPGPGPQKAPHPKSSTTPKER